MESDNSLSHSHEETPDKNSARKTSHLNIENQSREQTSESSSSNTPVKFKQVLNTKSTVEKTSDRNESVFPGVGASISSTSSQDEDLRCCTYDPNTVDKRRKSVSNKDLLERFTERPRTAGHFHDRAVTVAAIQHAAGGESSGSQNSELYLDLCPTPHNSEEESDSYEAVSVNGDDEESLNDIQGRYSDPCPAPHNSLEESYPYESVSVNGDYVESLSDIQERYSDPYPTPHNSVEESDPYESVSVNGDYVESLSGIQECYSDPYPTPHNAVEESDPYESVSVNGYYVESLSDIQERYSDPCPTPHNAVEESNPYEAVSVNGDVKSLNDIQKRYSDPCPTPHNAVEESDPYESVSVNGDEVEDFNDIQECYEKLCCLENDLVRIVIFSCLSFVFLLSLICMISFGLPYQLVLAVTIITYICFILLFKYLVKKFLKMLFALI